jgi:hypothetical protein
MDIKSTQRLDELFKKGQEEGLDARETSEFLFLVESRGLIIHKPDSEDKSANVH